MGGSVNPYLYLELNLSLFSHQKTGYSLASRYIEEQNDEIYDMIDWSMDFVFDEKIRDQGWCYTEYLTSNQYY